MFTRKIVECGLQLVRKSRELSYRQIRTLAGLNLCSCQPSAAKTCGTLNIAKPTSSLYFAIRQNSMENNAGKSSKKCKKEVDYEEMKSLLEKDQIHVFDVREPRELEETGKIHPKAVNIPLTKLKECLKSAEMFLKECKMVCPNKKEDIIFYGYADVKSLAALEIACKMGYTKAKHYPGGWQEWSQKSQT